MRFLRKNKFDIIHGDGAKGCLPIILSHQKKFISTIHDLGPFETKFTYIPIEKILIKFITGRATYITTVSNFITFQKSNQKKFLHFIMGLAIDLDHILMRQ